MTVHRSITVAGIAAAALAAVILAALTTLWLVQRDRILPATTIAGIDVGGLGEPAARAAIEPLVEQRRTEPVQLRFEGVDHTASPPDLGYHLDVDATIAAAFARGRDGWLLPDAIERIRALRGDAHDVPLVEEADPGPVTAWVDAIADEVDRQVSTGSVHVDPGRLEVVVSYPVSGVEVARDRAVEAVVAALTAERPEALELPAEVTPQPVDDRDVDAAAAIVRRALAGTLVLHASDTTLTLVPHDLARLLEVRVVPAGERQTLEVAVGAAAVAEVMGEVASARFDREPVSAGYAVEREPPVRFDAQGTTSFEPVPTTVEVVPGADGARFDAELAAAQLTELVRLGAREAQLRLEVVEPELPTAVAEELRPTHLLGTFTTYYQAGQARVGNIQRLADVIDGAVVLPGEQFSINRISGERTCDEGYVPAGTIIRGELVDTCGGGVSQFGTTTFNAAFFSGVQLDQWKAHSWYISRYPMGREATLNYPELDVRFTNTTPGALVVKTSHTPTSVTVSIHGQPAATRVTATHGQPFDHRSFSTQVRSTAALPRGQERVVQSGAGGFTVEVVRTIERPGGDTDTQTIRTVYVPQTRIVERGTAAPAATTTSTGGGGSGGGGSGDGDAGTAGDGGADSDDEAA